MKNEIEITIKISFISELGYDWLNEIITITPTNYQEIIRDYFQRNKEKAIALNNKWEDDSLFCLYCTQYDLNLSTNTFFGDILKFLERDEFYL